MKYILPLLLLTMSARSQSADTTYLFSGFIRITTILSFEGRHLSTKFDTVNLKNSFLPIRNNGDVWYLSKPIGDTLVMVVHNINIGPDTIHLGYKDSIGVARMDSYAWRNGIVGFYEFGKRQYNNSITDHLFIFYPETDIPEKKTAKRYWDRIIRSYQINIVRDQASPSD